MCMINSWPQLIFWSIVAICLTVAFVMRIDRRYKYRTRKAELNAQKDMEEMRLGKQQKNKEDEQKKS